MQAIVLQVSEFEPPMQLSFAECDRIDQAGRLRGLTADRRLTLARQEQMLAARYGTVPFRHVGQVDPGSILTERRFRWHLGLPWESAPQKKIGRKRA